MDAKYQYTNSQTLGHDWYANYIVHLPLVVVTVQPKCYKLDSNL